jgi:hypothetical protein
MSDIKFVETELALNGSFLENWKIVSESRDFASRGIRSFDFSFDDWKTYIHFGNSISADHIHLAMALFYFMQYCREQDTTISCKKQNGEEFCALFHDSGSCRFIHISCTTVQGQVVRFRAYDG